MKNHTRPAFHRVSAFSAALLFCTALCTLSSGTALAGFYKCIDADGNITYSQTECPVDETTDKIISAGSSSAKKNRCSIARHFINKTAKQMLRGQSSGEIFDQYGGIDSIPRSSVALINYVYTFQYNHKVTAERITALSMARCSSGSFGPTECDDFPYSYIDGLGGCDQAAMGPQYGRMSTAEEEYEQQGQAVQQSTGRINFGNQAGFAPPQTAVQQTRFKCIADTQARLADVANSMRQPLSAGEQDSLREQRRQLQKKLSRC